MKLPGIFGFLQQEVKAQKNYVYKSYAEACFKRGNAKYKLQDYNGALDDYNAAIKLDPNYANAYYTRGFAKKWLKDFKGAIEDYNKAIKFNPNFAKTKKPVPEHKEFSPENYVLIRLWRPHVGAKQTSNYPLAAMLGNVGHISIAIHDGENEQYVSHWPAIDGPFPKAVVSSQNTTLHFDIIDGEKVCPDECVAIYGFDTKKMIETFNEEICDRQWTLKSDSKNIKAYSCASAVYKLLEAGGLFDFYLNDKEKLQGTITPIEVMNLCEKAKKIIATVFPETKDMLLNLIEHEYIIAADNGKTSLSKFNEDKPDYKRVYQKLNSESQIFFDNINAKAERADKENKIILRECASAAAKQGHYVWRLFLNENPGFSDKVDQLFKEDKDNFIQLLTNLISEGDKKQTLAKNNELLDAIDDLIDINKKNSDEKIVKACQHNKVTYKYIDSLLENPFTDLANDGNGLNALHKAILKGDVYCTEKLIKKFPQSINEVVKVSQNNKSTSSYSMEKFSLFPNKNEVSYMGFSPLDLAKLKDDEKMINLLQEYGAQCIKYTQQQNSSLYYNSLTG